MSARVARWGRTALALVAFYGAFILLDLVLRALLGGGLAGLDAGRGLIRVAVPSVLAGLALYGAVLLRGGITPRQAGVPDARATALGLGWGLAWGAALAAGTLGLALAGGARVYVGPGFLGERYPSVALAVLIGLALAALVEELLFRGWPLVRLARAIRPVPASLVLSAAFVALHLPNRDVTALGLLNIGLAGLVLCGAFATGGLPGAFGLHLAWNAALALGADAPVSGLRFGLPAIEYVPGGASWWDGGRFGPEGGLAATLVLGVAAFWWVRRIGAGEVFRQSELA